MIIYKMLLKILILSFSLVYAEGINVLAVSGLISPSHYLFNAEFLLILADKGYNITFITHDKDKYHHPNLTHIFLEGGYEKFYGDHNLLDFVDETPWESINSLWKISNEICEHDVDTKGLKQIMNYPPDFKFDLAVWDISFTSCLFPILEKFGSPPLVGLNPFLLQPDCYGNVIQSFEPFYLKRSTDHMTFWERVDNNFWMLVMEITRHYFYWPEQTRIAKQIFGDNIKPLLEVQRNISLIFNNYNPAFNYPRALPANVIPIGGLQIKSKPLAKEFKVILDNAKNGVIVFSLGTNMKSAMLGEERINSILKVFGKLKQTVIWKFEAKLDNIPKNVHIRKWLPQSDIIGHPNVKLLIIHGGHLSSHEAVYHGVPIIIIPFFFDQLQNVHNLVEKKVALEFDFRKLNDSDLFYNTIKTITGDESYTKNAKKLSELYRDFPMTPKDRVSFWVDYILRHGTAKHFDLASRDMKFLEYTNIDLILLGIAVPLTILLVIIYLSCKVLSYVCLKLNKKQNLNYKKNQ